MGPPWTEVRLPVVALAVLAFAAGLLSGFGGFSFPALGVAAAACGVALCARRHAHVGLALALASGTLAARVSIARERECRSIISHASRWMVVLTDSVAPGAWGRGTIRDGGCQSRASLAVASGSARAGDQVEVRGTLIPTTISSLIRDASVRPTGKRDRELAWRAAASSNVRRAFQSDAPLALALLLAETRDLTPEMRDRYADAGVVHMLSISGLHVGIVAAAVILLASVLRVPRAWQWPAGALVTVGYVFLIGAPPAALRAAGMVAAVAGSRVLQRPTSRWALLAIGAAIPLRDPRVVTDIGYQLSVLGIASLIASAALMRRLRDHPRVRAMPGHARKVFAAMVTSVIASLAAAPLVAWSFGRLSLIGPIVNLIADPILALAQPMLFLSLVCAPAPTIASFAARAAHPLLVAFDATARIGAAVPHGTLEVAPSLSMLLCLAGAAVGLLAACLRRQAAPPLMVAMAALCIAAWMPAPRGTGEAELHMIDVGQGDALAIRTPRGRWVLVDAGRAWRGGDAGRQTVLPYLRRRGGPLVAFVLSHPHADHAGGAASVIEALEPPEYWDAAFAGGSETYHASLEAAQHVGTRWHRVHPGDSVNVDGVMLTFLAPDSAWTASLADPNNASTVMLARYGEIRFLFVGDAEADEEAWLLQRLPPGALHADVLKVGHHGSRTSTTAPFLAAVAPRVALVSVGLGNDYGHPSASVMAALARAGITIIRSDIAGSAVVRTDGRSLRVDAYGETWSIPPSSSASEPLSGEP